MLFVDAAFRSPKSTNTSWELNSRTGKAHEHTYMYSHTQPHACTHTHVNPPHRAPPHMHPLHMNPRSVPHMVYPPHTPTHVFTHTYVHPYTQEHTYTHTHFHVKAVTSHPATPRRAGSYVPNTFLGTLSVVVPEDREMRCDFISLGGQGRISLTIYICL